jgi:hypothetical protein
MVIGAEVMVHGVFVLSSIGSDIGGAIFYLTV